MNFLSGRIELSEVIVVYPPFCFCLMSAGSTEHKTHMASGNTNVDENCNKFEGIFTEIRKKDTVSNISGQGAVFCHFHSI